MAKPGKFASGSDGIEARQDLLRRLRKTFIPRIREGKVEVSTCILSHSDGALRAIDDVWPDAQSAAVDTNVLAI